METRLHVLDSTTSTNDVAFAELAAGRARHGDAWRAREQTAGRGRLGRRWESAPDEGLYLSLVWAPVTPPRHPAALTMAAGLGVFEAVQALGLTRAGLKWPNDVLVGGQKLAGILVESKDAAPSAFVVGVGLNVGQRTFPAELVAERPVTSLTLEGVNAPIERVAEAVLERLIDRLGTCDGNELERSALEKAYLTATGLRDEPVRVRRGKETLEGRLESIELSRGILLRGSGGDEIRIPVEHATAVETIR